MDTITPSTIYHNSLSIDWISSCLDKTTTVAEDTGGVTMDTTPIASCPNEWHLAPVYDCSC